MHCYREKKHHAASYIPQFIEKARKDNDIVTVYLFGSHARGNNRCTSDIDLAVLLDQNISPGKYFEKKLHLLAQATETLKTDEVDLVILNEAPVSLAYQIIRDGRVLYQKKGAKGQRVAFQTLTCDRYFDFQPTAKVLYDGLLQRIKGGRFGG
ncbi:nucleotidyltransferase domain-containing protein [Desulfallas sp. Bu1-1]|uniref:type VII toxin-antitoxin system MntA family adenylyltransferase antitoxin n=1 Tax=Desulfallas sp. Bu1-1 TaxID=2787620 RepID=UPI00189D9DA4|nr:nucleotidyltransferase domain-containing protein [Desulfallas sp. Bu1-1]MBF7083418.1 nucleotidyltransferase domain-containing protein [Desulfallas sp. Bu1-1]